MSWEDDEDFEDYESGPFCRHWGDPSDCEEKCARCGHRCSKHYSDECDEDGCECPAWVEAPEADEPSSLPAEKT